MVLFDAGEHVRGDALKDGYIHEHELGDINALQHRKDDIFLAQIRLSLHLAGRLQNSLQRPHAPVIVVLARQLQYNIGEC